MSTTKTMTDPKHPVLDAIKGSGIPAFRPTAEPATLTAKTAFIEDVPAEPVNHYERTYKGVKLDYYDLCDLYELADSAVAHAFKKLLRFGRGQHKSRDQDIAEAIQSLRRWQEKEAAKAQP